MAPIPLLAQAGPILDIVKSGVGKLMELIPLWFGAKTPEQKKAIEDKAVELVGRLDDFFAQHDAVDKAKMDDFQAQIDAAKARGE
jgi:hypothetical protein